MLWAETFRGAGRDRGKECVGIIRQRSEVKYEVLAMEVPVALVTLQGTNRNCQKDTLVSSPSAHTGRFWPLLLASRPESHVSSSLSGLCRAKGLCCLDPRFVP